MDKSMEAMLRVGSNTSDGMNDADFEDEYAMLAEMDDIPDSDGDDDGNASSFGAAPASPPGGDNGGGGGDGLLSFGNAPPAYAMAADLPPPAYDSLPSYGAAVGGAGVGRSEEGLPPRVQAGGGDMQQAAAPGGGGGAGGGV